jgi:hypothetical protein
MAKVRPGTAEETALGKYLAERAGLDPNKVKKDWDVQSYGETVTITFEVISTIPKSEFSALVDKFDARA